MIGFDLALGSASLAAPRVTLRFFGHEEPSPEVIAGLRRLSGIWLTVAAAHANAERRGGRRARGGAAGGSRRTGGRSRGCAEPRCSPTRSGPPRPAGAGPAAARRS